MQSLQLKRDGSLWFSCSSDSAEEKDDRVYMLEHNRVMNVSNKIWIHVNRFIRSASPKGLSQDHISEVDMIAGLP